MANLASSRTDPCTANVVTHISGASREGTVLLCKYSKGSGTSATIVVTAISKNINATDEYQPIYMSGTLVIPQTFFFNTPGNYRIPLSLTSFEKTIKASVSFVGGSDQTMVVDFTDD